MKLLFIAPQSNLSGNAELSRIASGNTLEVAEGALSRDGLRQWLRDPYDAVHFVAHGDKHILQLFAPDLIDSSDLASMMDAQRDAKFIFINACDSLSLATVLHNALHVPIISHDAPIEDVAAVRFAERFYREYKRTQNVSKSFDAAKETLLRLYPAQSLIPVLINGDMATHKEIDDCMSYLTTELTNVFEHFNQRLDRQDTAIAALRTDMQQLNKAPATSTRVMLYLIGALVFLSTVHTLFGSLFVR